MLEYDRNDVSEQIDVNKITKPLVCTSVLFVINSTFSK